MRIKGGDIVLIIVAILFPPLAVFLMTGCSCDLLINILLTVLGFIPGHLHAFWLIYKKIKAEEAYGPGGYKYTGSGVYAPVYAANPATAATEPQVGTYGTTGATVPPPVVDNKAAY
ncbi:hypothetical protein M407DRAFT_241610 [Tulasnella calospora MUT 4182]|uniref:Uncharacterized protein n=1 Tax=Tulasnella calospora MUT 4182 TaxID=1051891 RepID=A0A0C3LD63_9AGAM|nr:hypothetical protein M407DRAFT_241610 [Tulasnella calospora MUT 4182]